MNEIKRFQTVTEKPDDPLVARTIVNHLFCRPYGWREQVVVFRIDGREIPHSMGWTKRYVPYSSLNFWGLTEAGRLKGEVPEGTFKDPVDLS